MIFPSLLRLCFPSYRDPARTVALLSRLQHFSLWPHPLPSFHILFGGCPKEPEPTGSNHSQFARKEPRNPPQKPQGPRARVRIDFNLCLSLAAVFSLLTLSRKQEPASYCFSSLMVWGMLSQKQKHQAPGGQSPLPFLAVKALGFGRWWAGMKGLGEAEGRVRCL